jgi:epoxyqueuosine reductase
MTASFRALFAGSPVKRTGRDRFIRNVLIAAGNSGDAVACSAPRRCLPTPPAGAGHGGVGAVAPAPEPDFTRLRNRHMNDETDADVRREWETA